MAVDVRIEAAPHIENSLKSTIVIIQKEVLVVQSWEKLRHRPDVSQQNGWQRSLACGLTSPGTERAKKLREENHDIFPLTLSIPLGTSPRSWAPCRGAENMSAPAAS